MLNLAPPDSLVALPEHARRWLAQDYQQLRTLFDSTTKAMSKKAMSFFVPLIKYHSNMYRNDVLKSMPDEIAQEQQRLKQWQERLAAEQKTANTLSRSLKQVLSEAEIKQIKGCLHPDRAPEGRKDKFNNAFKAFQNAVK
jgi:hemoglobin-like flavoprotein